jgi:exodeoxyribonuclease VII small subunit
MKDLSFEEAKAKIEQIINNMEMGNLPLEESVSQFEEAAKLVKYCQEKLDEYKGKIEAINVNSAE